MSSVGCDAFIENWRAAAKCGDNSAAYNRHSLVYRVLCEATLYSKLYSVDGHIEFFEKGSLATASRHAAHGDGMHEVVVLTRGAERGRR